MLGEHGLKAVLQTGAVPAQGTAAGTTIPTGLAGATSIAILAKFVYGSAGTTCKAYVQTSLDGGVTWIDIASFAFATTTATKMSAVSAHVAATAAQTPSDGALTDNTIVNGIIGDRLRVKTVVVGTYVASTLEVAVVARR